jgi:hypothetical protein
LNLLTFYWDKSPRSKPLSQHGTLNSAVTVYLAQENARASSFAQLKEVFARALDRFLAGSASLHPAPNSRQPRLLFAG